MRRIRVLVQATDPLIHAGITAMLHACLEIRPLTEEQRAYADVVVLAEGTVGAGHLREFRKMRAQARTAPGPVAVLVAGHFAPEDTLLAARCGVMSILSASSTTEAQLVAAAIGAVNSVSLWPSQLQAALLRKLGELHSTVLEPNGLSFTGLHACERDVIGFVADGLGTDEIAERIGCSEWTTRNILQTAMRRLGLNNRSHAVAYAIRSGALGDIG